MHEMPVPHLPSVLVFWPAGTRGPGGGGGGAWLVVGRGAWLVVGRGVWLVVGGGGGRDEVEGGGVGDGGDGARLVLLDTGGGAAPASPQTPNSD